MFLKQTMLERKNYHNLHLLFNQWLLQYHTYLLFKQQSFEINLLTPRKLKSSSQQQIIVIDSMTSNRYPVKVQQPRPKQQPLYHPVRQQIVIPNHYHSQGQWMGNVVNSNLPKNQNPFQTSHQRYEVPQLEVGNRYLKHHQKIDRKESINLKPVLENRPSQNLVNLREMTKSPNRIVMKKNVETKARIMSPINTNVKRESNYEYNLNKNQVNQQVYSPIPEAEVGKAGEPIRYFKKRSVQINVQDNKNYIISNQNIQPRMDEIKLFQKEEPEEKETYYISDLLANMNNKKSVVYLHFYQIFKGYKQHQKQLIPQKEIQPISLPQDPSLKNRKTIVFDLDETLIHCTKIGTPPYDVKLSVKQPDRLPTEVGFNIRPYAKEILENLSKHFEIIVFTASHGYYANVILNYLDPDRKFIHHRLFRESCQEPKKGFFVKDLRIIPRSLSNMILVDNASLSYCFQPDNGIPIISYIQGKSDNELKKLESYLMKFKNVNDVRSLISSTFKTTEYVKFNHTEDAIRELYAKSE